MLCDFVDPHASLFGRGGPIISDPHDNKHEEVVHFPWLRSCMTFAQMCLLYLHILPICFGNI